MAKLIDWSEVPVGHYLAEVRDEAGMTQAALANRVTLSTATLSRIESGEKLATEEEVTTLLKAIGSPTAKVLAEYLKQEWDQIERPAFDHPDRSILWEANLTLRKLDKLRNDPDVKGVFIRQMDLYEKEILRLCQFLQDRRHQVAFIGGIGVGKSTAICKLVNLLKRTEEKLDRQIVLETGAGGITLCEVHITEGPRYGIRIVPRTEDSIRKDVEDFADYLFRITRPEGIVEDTSDGEEGDPLGISKEVVRAIRNMAGLTEKRKEENGRRVRIDPAKDLAQQYETAQELAIQILTRMDLLRRNRRDAWYPDDSPHPATHWLQQVFSELNNGRNSEFTLPQKIEVVVPYPVFESRELPLRLIDTKGIDQTAERQDLECHLDDPRTLVVLCSRFNDAPEVAIQTLLNRAQDAGVRDIALKTLLLVLPRPEEALAVKHDDGTRVEDEFEGYELKGDQVKLRLTPRGLSNVGVEFFNAREDEAEPLRDRFVAKIAQQRQTYANQLSQLSMAVERLIENRKKAEVEAVFEHVSSDLGSWIDNNRSLSSSGECVQEPLISAIDATRYASRVRAAVRRYGDYVELDYYHHLAFGVRKLAVAQIGAKAGNFNVIVSNLLANDELSPAKEFLERVLGSMDAAVDEAYKRVQTAGRETFKQTLEQDFDFWGKCEGRWGQGKGYRHAISEMTDVRFQSSYEEAHRLVKKLIQDEWSKIVALLESMLRQSDAVETV
jgi:transcriptional regulator with XRE-family HTH domain